MIQQTILPFKIEITKETLTAHSGLALLAEFNHGIGLRELINRHLLKPGNNRGFMPSVFVDPLVLMQQGGGRNFEDIRELTNESGLMKLIDCRNIPSPDATGDWCRRMGSDETGQVGFYTECKERMPEGKRIARYRADRASYQAELINILDKDRVKFTITADQDTAVKKAIESIPEEEWERPNKECDYEIAVTVHSMNDTKKAFTLVIKREAVREKDLFERQEERYRYYVIATNYEDEERDAHSILLFHNGRGDAENFNKELKIGLGMERMPSGQSAMPMQYFSG